jgi:hypothetical protein
MKLPLELVRKGSTRISKPGETRNMSTGGVLFTSDAAIQVGELIEYFITLPTGQSETSVRLRCMGKVTRLGADPAGETVGRSVAATVERYEFVRI